MAETIYIHKAKDTISYSRPLDYVIGKLRCGDYELVISRKSQKRSTPQNSLLWMWIACLEDETGMAKRDIYDAYCARFLARPIRTPRGMVMANTTSSHLNKNEFTAFLDKIQADAAEMGIRLPQPNDEFFSEFYNEYHNRV